MKIELLKKYKKIKVLYLPKTSKFKDALLTRNDLLKIDLCK